MSTHSDILDRIEQRRRALFGLYNDLRRAAQDSEDYEAHRLVGEAYQAFVRSFLSPHEQAFIELQNANAELQAELNQWRKGIRRTET